MSQPKVHAIFASLPAAGSALSALITAGMDPKKISVIGQDSDTFR